MSSTELHKRVARMRPRRGGTRGIVMAEAAIVISTLVVFVGAIGFLHNGLAAKLDVQQQARESAFQNATQHCSSGPDDNLAAVDLPIDGVKGQAADLLGDLIQGLSPINYGAAHTTTSRSVAGAMAGYNAQGTMTSNPLGITVTGDSHVLCTPEPTDGNLGGIVEFGVKYMKGRMENVTDIVGKIVKSAVDYIWDKITGLFS